MGWSRDLGFVQVDEVAGMVKAATKQLPAEDRSTVAAAIEAAKAGVAAMGGHAHVWLGGHEREAFDDESAGGRHPAQKSISVTITLRGDEGPPIKAPAAAVAAGPATAAA